MDATAQGVGTRSLRTSDRQGGTDMLLAILYALGVCAGDILLLLIGMMLDRRYKTIKHPARVQDARPHHGRGVPGTEADLEEVLRRLGTTVFTTRKGLPLAITDAQPMAGLVGVREAVPADEVKGLGDSAIIASFRMVTGARIDVALAARRRTGRSQALVGSGT